MPICASDQVPAGKVTDNPDTCGQLGSHNVFITPGIDCTECKCFG